jgi:hypothetical protein
MSEQQPAAPRLSNADARPAGTLPESGLVPGESAELVHNIGKLLRVGGMLREMLDEARRDSLDAEARRRAVELLTRCIEELKGAISADLAGELDRISVPFGGVVPTQSELRLTQAQLVGWFEGLFHGMQATLMGQQMGGAVPHPLRRPGPSQPESRPGQYL